jgi:hypothetical protein
MTLGRGCALQPKVRQMRILQAQIVFQLSMQRIAGERYIRECLTLVPRPTHASYLAPGRRSRVTPVRSGFPRRRPGW